jgi:DHA1 family multidrug resistance protein-like MFS transporter
MVGIARNALSLLLFGLSTELWMLFVSRALAGVLSSATLPTAMAYIGDSTTEEERGGGMGMMGAAMGVGMVLGPGLGGWLATQSLALPFFVGAALSALAFVFVFFALPESLTEEARSADGGGLRGPRLAEMWRALFGPIGFLLIFAFLVSFGLTNFEAVFGLYALERYDYGPRQVGTILTAIGLASAVVQGVLTGPLTRRWGEAALIRVSLLGSAVGFVLMLQAESFLAVLLTVSFFIISTALLRPAISSLISRRTTSGQGVAMGLNNSFMSLGRVAGPTWAGFVFDVDLSYPYYTGATVMLVGFLLSLFWLKGGAEGTVTPQAVSDAEGLA